MDRVAIVGAAQTAFSEKKVALTFADMAYDVTTRALEDAGMTIADIGNIVTVSNDFWDGRTISSMAVGDAIGAAYGDGKNISTVEGDGTFGAFYGLARILSHSYKSTLVVAHSKASEGDPRLISNALFDPLYERPMGADRVAAAALQAQVFMQEKGVSLEDIARVVVKNRKNGAVNPNAHRKEAISHEQALNAKPIALPLKEHDVSPMSDGAAAIILAGESVARKTPHPVWVKGVAFAADAYYLGERDLSESPALRQAAQKAYAMAGVKDPAREIHAAEIYDEFSYQEIMWLKELGLTGSALPVNASGGCLSAHTVIVAGLVRMIEASLQIRGKAANQQNGIKTALAHGQNGLCGQSHCVWILGN
ncbi:MAG: thiolase family protein [Elusimicrobiota bacterium]